MSNINKCSLSQHLKALLGDKGWLTGPDEFESYSADWLGRRARNVIGVALPKDADETAGVLRLCAQAHVAVVPQGGNTGLVQGALPDATAPSILVSCRRMNTIREINVIDAFVEVEAGVTLAQLNDGLAQHGLQFPMRLGSEGSAQIGGLIATNAGGGQSIQFGLMQDHVLGLEVVLPKGTTWNGLRAIRKDNSGYQLRKLFCGAEGTLGVVTRAMLSVIPTFTQSSTALIGVGSIEDALQVLDLLRRKAGPLLISLDFFSDTGLRLVERHIKTIHNPLSERSAWYLVIEISSTSEEIETDALLQKCLETLFEQFTITDGVIAQNESQQKEIWRLREEVPEAQRLHGPQLKHDIALPASRVAAFLNATYSELDSIHPGIIVNAFGHLGDGNIHYNLSPTNGANDFSGMEKSLTSCVYQSVVALGGSFAAEHGLGRQKVEIADTLRSSEERSIMRAIKQAIDPNGHMNPGCVV